MSIPPLEEQLRADKRQSRALFCALRSLGDDKLWPTVDMAARMVDKRVRKAGAAASLHTDEELERIAAMPRRERRKALSMMRRAYRQAKAKVAKSREPAQ